MRSRLLRGFLLDDVLVEPLRGQVSHQGVSSHLPHKAVEVLLQLACHPRELVTRTQLLESIWGENHGSDDALNHAVSEIRHALADHHDNPHFIQTIPRRGYRLLVEPRLSEKKPGSGEQGDNALTLIGAPPFFRELMRRKVVQTAVAYLLVAWLLVQIADTTFDNLGLPWWSEPFVTILVVIGFPIAIVLSWFMEFAGGRIRLEKSSHAMVGQKSVVVYMAVIGALIVSAGGIGMYRLLNEDASLFGTPPENGEKLQLSEQLQIPVLPNSVAVLRFVNFGDDSRISDGLSENLLHLLASISELSVPSRTSTWNLAGQGLPSTQLARLLNVRYVLEGSVQQVDNSIRVTTQFIDGRSGHHLWSENYDREMKAEEYFSILDDIARRVVEKLQVTLSLESSAVFARSRTSSTEALDFYLQGREQLRKPKSDETLGLSVIGFENAVNKDAHFTEAHAGLCDAYLAWYVMTRESGYFEKAEKSCLRSLTLDESLGEVYAAMGSLHRYVGKFDDAQLELENARALLPHSAAVLEELGRVYRAQNKLELAEKTFNQAIWEEPSSWSVYKSLGNFLFRTGRYQEALPLYRYVIELAPDNPPGYNNLGITYYMLGRFDEAIEIWNHIIDDSPSRGTIMNYANSLYYKYEFEQSASMYERAAQMTEGDYRIWENLAASLRHVDGAEQRRLEASQRAIELAEESLRINPLDADVLARLALLYTRNGQSNEAQKAVIRLYEQGWDDPDVSFILALVLLESGEKQEAMEELQKSVNMGFPPVLIAADPDFVSLRESPEFVALVEKSSMGRIEY
ncbi:MAG: tetratricopeptide repeat protein [Gammaproteobacteria bacterium]|nr:tetratricopeptide repeat protein [Gammaproteobacteria bacterium]